MRMEPIPQEIIRFNWAAFLFPVGWALFFGPRLLALVFAIFGLLVGQGFVWLGARLSLAVPALVLFAAQLWYGFNANRLTWQAGRGTIAPDFLLARQRSWTIGVTVVLLFITAIGVGGRAVARTDFGRSLDHFLWQP